MKKFINTQLSLWPTACANFRALKKVKTKSVNVGGLDLVLQHNPARIISSAAKIDSQSLKGRKCFLCAANRPAEQISMDFEGRKGRKYDILLNPYPIFRDHIVIAMKEHCDQSIWRRYVDMLDLSTTLKDYIIFYNGPKCGASAPDHHHFQAALRGQMPLENDMDALFDSLSNGTAEEANPLKYLSSCLDASLYHYDKYLPGIFAIKGRTSKSVAKLFYRLLDCAQDLDTESDKQTDSLPGQNQSEPMCNVFLWHKKDEYRSIIVFRSAHRSHHYFSYGPDHLTMSPGCADMAGCLIVPVPEEFEKIDQAMVTDLLHEVALSPAAQDRITKRLTRAQQTVSVGIMSAPELVFEILSDGAGPRRARYREGKIEYDGSLYDELFFEAQTPSTMFAKPSFRLFGVVIGQGFHWEQKMDYSYAGALKIIVEGEKLTAIDVLGIEDYLLSVISSEMKASAPIEFLKAHALISRSWLIRQCRHIPTISVPAPTGNTDRCIRWYDKKDHTAFDVCADDHCQRYQGFPEENVSAAMAAIDQTWGQVLEYQGEICDTRFSKCCGGTMERFSTCWADEDYDYLQSLPDEFCGRATPAILAKCLNHYDMQTTDFYRWTVEYGRAELSELFARRSGMDIGEIQELIPLDRGGSGRIYTLEIVGSKKTVIIGKELEIRRLLSESHLKSSAFEVSCPEPDKIVLKGSGWGHGVGLCQIGAAVMAEEGYDYQQILSHYYPGSKISDLSFASAKHLFRRTEVRQSPFPEERGLGIGQRD